MGGVILGMPGQWAEDNYEKSDHYTTKIGGVPDWPVKDMDIPSDLLKCGLCGGNLCLVAQVYAPISSHNSSVEERVIYVLGCPMPQCGSSPHSWRVLRVQKCFSNIQSGHTSPQAMSSAENSVPISKSTNWWQEGLWTSGSGEHGEESDDDMDLQELSRALSEAATLASHAKKQNGYVHPEALEKDLKLKPRVTDANIPVIPCFYIFSQEVQSSGDMSAVCANYSLLSIKGDQSPGDHEDGEGWEGESYEYDRALGADRTYLKFKKQMEAYPEQCFRYSYGGNPVLATTNMGEVDNCRFCGASRHYEMQMMPPLLYFLHQAIGSSSTCSSEEWNWMTLIIYTCSKNCCPSSCEEKSGSCCWFVAEEAIIIQNETVVPHHVRRNPEAAAGLWQRRPSSSRMSNLLYHPA